MRFKKLMVAAVVLPALVCQSAHAVDIFVGPNGDDNRSTTTTALPFKTLAKAASVANPGDIIKVKAGTYAPFTITRSGTLPATATSGIVSPAANDATRIRWQREVAGSLVEVVGDDSGGPAIRVQGSNNSIDGFTIRGNTEGVTLQQVRDYYIANPNGNKYNGSGILLDNTGAATPAHGLWLRNSVIRNFGCHGVEVIGSDYSAIDRNHVYDNAAYSSKNCSGIALSVAAKAGDPTTANNIYHSVIIGNKVWNNRVLVTNSTLTRKHAGGNGIVVGPVAPGYLGRTFVYTNVITDNGASAIVLSDALRTEVGYNTTYLNAANSSAAEVSVTGSTDVNVKSNIFYAKPNGLVYAASGNIVTTSVLLKVDLDWNHTFNGAPLGAQDNIQDPQFNAPGIDPRSADFRLKSTSSAIDGAPGGNSSSRTWLRADLPNHPGGATWGFDGDGLTFRGQGGAPDRGAYEFAITNFPLGWGTPNDRRGVPVGVGAASDSAGETFGEWLFVSRGTGLRGIADSFASGFRAWTGDVVMTARMKSAFVQDDREALAGLGIRTGVPSTTVPLAPNAQHASTLVVPGVGPMFVRRAVAGQNTRRSAGSIDKTQDVWLRIARVGNVFTSSASADGITWSVIRSETIVMPATVLVGFSVSNGKPTSFVTANQVVFDNVTVVAK
ncbi:MAG: DUF1565 domain-containing protein [Pseudomonadota bacterium]